MNNCHPNRKKSKDNPYSLIINNEKPYLSFIDSMGEQQTVELTTELYEAFSCFELEDISQMNKDSRHINKYVSIEQALENNLEFAEDAAETTALHIIANKVLLEAINQLNNTQRRRFVLHYYYDLTYRAIADVEGCTIMPVIRSVNSATEKIENYLKKRGYFFEVSELMG